MAFKTRQDLPPPIIFSFKYMDKTLAINSLVKSCYEKLQTVLVIILEYL